jgi:DNA repair exonuclease SbcCD ATPase subunit
MSRDRGFPVSDSKHSRNGSKAKRLEANVERLQGQLETTRIDRDLWRHTANRKQDRVNELEAEIERVTDCLRVADADRVPLAMGLEIARERIAELEAEIDRLELELEKADEVRRGFCVLLDYAQTCSDMHGGLCGNALATPEVTKASALTGGKTENASDPDDRAT